MTMAPARPPAAVDQDVILRADGVRRAFASRRSTVEALGPIDLRIGRGEFVAIVGPSGCGKSTLLRIAAGLVNPTEGTLELFPGRDNRRLLAMVFQDYGIFPWKNVRDNVRFALDLEGAARPSADAIAEEWLERLGLAAFADALPGTLSGGMRQRVAIARAFASDPDLLLMDEPFAALDAQLRTILQDELLTLTQESNRSVVFVTHSLDEAIVLADRVLVMSSRPGRIIADHRVPFARPRRTDVRAQPAFGELREELWNALRVEVEAARPGRSSEVAQ